MMPCKNNAQVQEYPTLPEMKKHLPTEKLNSKKSLPTLHA